MARVPRIFCAEDLSPGRRLRLPEAGARHLLRVLRLRCGDTVRLFDGSGAEYAAVLIHTHGSVAEVTVTEPVATLPEPTLRVHLLQGVSRGERMDWVIQKATELGVCAVHPILTARSVVKFSPDRALNRSRHWTAVAIAACEQCGRSSLPEIVPPVPFDTALVDCPATGMKLYLDAADGCAMTELARPQGGLALLIGPEGGLTPDERADARAAGFQAVNMGPRVMRTETAALAALAVAQTLWGDLSASPTPCRSA